MRRKLRRPPTVLELTSPPWHVQAVSRDDPGPCQNLPVEGPHKGTQLTRALPGQRVKHGFEVLTEAGAVTPALRDSAIGTREGVYKVPEGAMSIGLPVPERFFRGFGPEASSLQPTQVSGAAAGQAINERVPSPPPVADREITPQG